MYTMHVIYGINTTKTVKRKIIFKELLLRHKKQRATLYKRGNMVRYKTTTYVYLPSNTIHYN